MQSTYRNRALEAGILLLAPIALYFAIRPNLFIGHLPGFDANLYTACMYNLQDLCDRFGGTYYPVRFGVVIPGMLFAQLFEPITAFLLLRYALLLLAGLPVYALCKKLHGPRTALLVYLLLCGSPLLIRPLDWDSPEAFGVPYTLAGAALVLLRPTRRYLCAVAIGVLACLAVNCNIFLIVCWTLLFIPYVMLAWPARSWQERVQSLGLEGGCFLIGFASTFGLAIWFYHTHVGYARIWEPTFQMVKWMLAGGQNTWREPGTAWLLTYPVIYLPLYLLGYSLWQRRQQRPATGVTGAAVAWMAAVYGFHVVFDVVLGGYSLRSPLYFFYALPALLLVAAVLLANGIAAVATTQIRYFSIAATLLILLLLPSLILPHVDEESIRALGFVALAVAVTVSVVLCAASKRTQVGSVSALLGLLLVLNVSPCCQEDYTALHSAKVRARNTEAFYRSEIAFIASMPRYRDDPSSLLFWYSDSSENGLLSSLQFTYLWGYSRLLACDRLGDSVELSAVHLERLRQHDRLVLLAENAEDLQRRRAVLDSHQIVYNAHTPVEYPFGKQRVLLQFLDLGLNLKPGVPCTIQTDASGKQLLSPASVAYPLPLDAWSAHASATAGSGAGAVVVQTPAQPWALVTKYPPLHVTTAGTYTFLVRYHSPARVVVRIGLLNHAANDQWLDSTLYGRTQGSQRIALVQCRLERGQVVVPVLTALERTAPAELILDSFEAIRFHQEQP